MPQSAAVSRTKQMSIEQPFKLSARLSHWRRCGGSLFHRRGPADAKHRSPESVTGTSNDDSVLDDRQLPNQCWVEMGWYITGNSNNVNASVKKYWNKHTTLTSQSPLKYSFQQKSHHKRNNNNFNNTKIMWMATTAVIYMNHLQGGTIIMNWSLWVQKWCYTTLVCSFKK